MDKKEFMKKVVAILEKQQATLKKLAEKNPNDPFVYENIQKGDPLGWDLSMTGGKTLDELMKDPAPTKKAPAPKPTAQPKVKHTPAAVNGLPPEVMSALDNSEAKQFKGNLMLSFSGPEVRIMFNADRVKMSPMQVQDILQKALPSYKVDAIGEHNSGMKDWQPNY